MRDTETVLAIIRERGKRGLPLERIYRLLYNPNLFLRAYRKLYPNHGALTPGSTPETVDGMSVAKIERLIDDLRHERYRWTPVRRTYIEKKTSTKKRPLGLPSWSDKLLQEVIRIILEAYYEPQLSDHSHGFRPGRGCHTPLRDIQTAWTGVRWFIEGDISQYFDRINHSILVEILSEKLHDNRFLRLLRNLLRAGYMEAGTYHQTLSGAPQGGVLSPLLSNLYLDRFDQYVDKILIPAYTRGEKRAVNPPYQTLSNAILRERRQGDKERVRQLCKERQQLPSKDPHDPTYRRLRYVRYADDWLLGFAGPRHEAEEIKHTIGTWLHDNLTLTLSEEKTLITQASHQAARFLGYEIVNQQGNDQHDGSGRRSVNGAIALRVPQEVVEHRRAQYKRRGIVMPRPELLQDDDYSILVRYQQEYRGIVQYYALAQNVSWFGKLHWDMKVSLLKTLAWKHKSSVNALSRKYRATVQTPDGTTLKCLEVRVNRKDKPPMIARFGGISLKRQPWAILDDQPLIRQGLRRTEILKRLQADECELCGSDQAVQVHHIRKLADLRRKGERKRPSWVVIMATRQRKTLVVCRDCHQNIHAGRPTRQAPRIEPLERRMP